MKTISEGKATYDKGRAPDAHLTRRGSSARSKTAALSNEEIVKIQRELIDEDPALWTMKAFNIHLWSKQREVLNSTFRERLTAVHSCNSAGKTFVAACTAVSFLLSHRNARVITSAPTMAQVRWLLWAEINSLVKGHVLPQFDAVGTDYGVDLEPYVNSLRLGPDWFALGISPGEDVNFQGFHGPYVLVILDEASGVDREIFEAAQSLCASGDAHMLLIGNPLESSGFFYDACMGVAPGWNVIHIDAMDTPNFTDERAETPPDVLNKLVQPIWVEERRAEWGEDSPMWQSRIRGVFPDLTTNTVIPLSFFQAGVARRDAMLQEEINTPMPKTDPRLLGVDVAWEGDDKSAYVARLGNHLEILGFDSGQDPMAVAGRVGRICIDYEIQICAIDAIGIGGGVLSRLQERAKEDRASASPTGLGRTRFVGVKASEKASEPENFPNKRAEMWWNLREALDPTHGWLGVPDDPTLRGDLTQSKYNYTSRQQIQVEPKMQLKKRIGRSPDYGDGAMFVVEAGHLMNMQPLMKNYYAVQNRAMSSEDGSTGAGRPGASVIPSIAGIMGDMP